MRRGRLLLSAVAIGTLTLALFATGTLSGKAPVEPRNRALSASPGAVADPVVARIAAGQRRLSSQPKDARAWAALALDYIDQAKATADPSWYAKAEGATRKALALDPDGNDLGYAARAALDSGRHAFRAALVAARRGLSINPFSATLYGAQADALTQLGRYDGAAKAVQRMNELRPGVPAFTRASYVLELRGDIAGAQAALERALSVATSQGDQAFVRLSLGDVAFNYRADSQGALENFEQGLRVAPHDHALQAARAKALAALGRTKEAVESYQRLVAAAPAPPYVLELAELLQALGAPGAAEQFQVFRTALALYRANGVAVDVEATLFAADHDTPARALQAAVRGWRSRPFVEMADAYGWALYRNHRYAEALEWSDRARADGWSSPLALYHRGMIQSRLGQRSAGLATLRRCLTLNPAFDPLRAPLALAELRRLEGTAPGRRGASTAGEG